MRTAIYTLIFLICMTSCGDTHFITDSNYRKSVEKDFFHKKELMPHGDLFAILDTELTTYEREALEFLYAYMPIADITDYSGEFHLMNIRASQKAISEMSWGKDIPEELFRHFILPVRINNEHLDSARVVFYSELKDRVKNLSMKEAILEVNHWCHEKAVYQPTDGRTCSPLSIVKTAYGRCGEESTFLVAALRAIGIPARQVYTPRWAHTDDNHAWVEAWADGKWHFLGACEPEPVLDLGWFNAPASRGMLMHTRVFGRYEGKEEIMSTTPNYTEINVTDNYADTESATIYVKDMNGKPVNGALVEFKIYNYAEFYTVAGKISDSKGKCGLTAGKGDMLVWASKSGCFGFAKLSFGKQKEITIVLDKQDGDKINADIDITPPSENPNTPMVTSEQRAENDKRIAQEDSIRHAYTATFHTAETAEEFINKLPNINSIPSDYRNNGVGYLIASCGNHSVIEEFLQQSAKNGYLIKAFNLLSSISQKDLRDIRLNILNDNIINTPNPESEIYTEEYRISLLSPRIITEDLTAYKEFFRKEINNATAESYRKSPQKLIEWCNQNISLNDTLNSQNIIISPEGVWNSRMADARSRNVFFVAICRSIGIPAWIDEVTGKILYKKATDSRIYTADFDNNVQESIHEGTLYASYSKSANIDNPQYYTHFTLSRLKNGKLRLLNYDETKTSWQSLLKNGTKIEVGNYLITTGTRLAKGGVLAHIETFDIKDRKPTEIKLVLRENKDEVQVIGSFNSESLFTPIMHIWRKPSYSSEESILQACGRGYFIIGILGVNQEPTNHALKDIAKLSNEFENCGHKIVLLFPNVEKLRESHEYDFEGLPSNVIYGIDTNGITEQIVNAMKLRNSESLPIFIIADTFNRVVFISQGYSIGLGNQLIQTIKNVI